MLPWYFLCTITALFRTIVRLFVTYCKYHWILKIISEAESCWYAKALVLSSKFSGLRGGEEVFQTVWAPKKQNRKGHNQRRAPGKHRDGFLWGCIIEVRRKPPPNNPGPDLRHCKNDGWVPSSFIYYERNQSSRVCKGQKSKENEMAVMICEIREKMVNHYRVNKKKGTGRDWAQRKAKEKVCAVWNSNALEAPTTDLQQFSVDRMDNNNGYTKDNVRLVCLKCNQSRRCAQCTQGESDAWRGVASNSFQTKPRLSLMSK